MQPQRKTIITEEGELRDVPTTSPEPATYCPQCGTANRIDSHFCRNCGTSLDDLDSAPREKPKHGQSEQATPNVWSALTEIATLLMVMVMGVAAVANPNGNATSWVIIPIAVGWLITTAARHGTLGGQKSQSAPNVWSALTEIATTFAVMIMSVAAVANPDGNATSWIVIPIVVGWIISTAARHRALN
jgi:hypothetical protein